MTLRPYFVFWASHRGIRPRLSQVSRLFSGSRYLAATLRDFRCGVHFLAALQPRPLTDHRRALRLCIRRAQSRRRLAFALNRYKWNTLVLARPHPGW